MLRLAAFVLVVLPNRSGARPRTLTPAQRARAEAATLRVADTAAARGAWDRSQRHAVRGSPPADDVRTFTPPPSQGGLDSPQHAAQRGGTAGAATEAPPASLALTTPGLVGGPDTPGSRDGDANAQTWPLPPSMRQKRQLTREESNFRIPLDPEFFGEAGDPALNDPAAAASSPGKGRDPRGRRQRRGDDGSGGGSGGGAGKSGDHASNGHHGGSPTRPSTPVASPRRRSPRSPHNGRSPNSFTVPSSDEPPPLVPNQQDRPLTAPAASTTGDAHGRSDAGAGGGAGSGGGGDGGNGGQERVTHVVADAVAPVELPHARPTVDVNDPEAGPTAAYGDPDREDDAAAKPQPRDRREAVLARIAPVTTVLQPDSPLRSPPNADRPAPRSLFPPRQTSNGSTTSLDAAAAAQTLRDEAPRPSARGHAPTPPPRTVPPLGGGGGQDADAGSASVAGDSGRSLGAPPSRGATTATTDDGGSSTGRSALQLAQAQPRDPQAVVFDVRELHLVARRGTATSNPHAVWEGDILWKIPFTRAGVPRKRFFQVVSRPAGGARRLHLQWGDPSRPRQRPRSIQLDTVEQIIQGHQTDAFLQQKPTKKGPLARKNEHLCFSLLAKTRSVDIAAMSESQRDDWLAGLESVIRHELAIASGSPLGSDSAVLAAAPDGLSHAATHRSGSTHAESVDVDVEHRNNRSRWLASLFDACRHDRVSAVQRMLDEGCPVDLMEPRTGDTPLLIACRNGLVDLADLALQRGARNDPHPSYGRTGLQLSIAHGHYEVAKLLLETAAMSDSDKAIVNHADSRRAAALHNAALNGDVRCAELLLAVRRRVRCRKALVGVGCR